MVIVHPVSDFIDDNDVAVDNSSPKYWYQGRCPQTNHLLKLPRSAKAEAIALGLMQYLGSDPRYSQEGKMYGVLLVELPNGNQGILKAFSGLLNGEPHVEGWVPPIPGRDRVAFSEAQTLAQLTAIKEELITLQQLPQHQELEARSQEFEQQLQLMSDRHRDLKQQRQAKRQYLCEMLTDENLAFALQELDCQSRLDGIERRNLKRKRDQTLQPLKQLLAPINERIQTLKQQRKTLSRELQSQMYAAYSLTNFAGESRSLQGLIPTGAMPTGTGDCCAPKLLHYAATQGFKPLAMAEFWWGSANTGDKIQGEFYPACVERCEPLMGFLLSGLSNATHHSSDAISSHLNPTLADQTLSIVYEDEFLIGVDKPPGLLSVPGRYRDRMDSVLSRLRVLLPDGMKLMAVHRLDQDTSGILLLARDRSSYIHLSQQFQQRQVHKVYEAILAGSLKRDRGLIKLPLWGDPQNRPYQTVDFLQGKPSLTRFQVIRQEGHYTRIEFYPLTGRTHQLRVHAADPRGLGTPILGDRLYGSTEATTRLHLHARELHFTHPHSGQKLTFHAPASF